MEGSTYKRLGMATLGILFLAGCVGLGDSSSETVAPNRPRSRLQSPAESPTPNLRIAEDPPELRIPDNTVVQATSDIPLVPVPPPPVSRPSPGPTRSSSSPPAAPAPAQTAPAAAPPPPASPPVAPPQAANPQPDGTSPTPTHTARQLLQQAAERCTTLDTYIVRLTRREQLKGKVGPEEIIALSFRKKPFSVHFKWLGETAKGREVVYVKDHFDNKIHTKVAKGDSLLLPAGARLSLSPDNPLVRSASRHPITDAGICHCVQSMTEQLDAQERGDRRQGTLTVIAPQRRPEYPQPVETVERLIPPGVEPELPRGGRRLIFFDPEWRLPMVVVAYDERGTEVEYYRYDRLITPANLDDDDFNPDKLWPPQSPQRQQGRNPR